MCVLAFALAATLLYPAPAPVTPAPLPGDAVALPVPRPAAPRPPPRPRRQGPNAEVHWRSTTSTAGCFFFSGPGQLGRDDALGDRAQWSEQGGRVTLDFGRGVVFSGTRNGNAIVLRRASSHAYGQTWTTNEVLTLSAGADNRFTGTYGYTECDTTTPASCPGTCTIASSVSIVVRR